MAGVWNGSVYRDGDFEYNDETHQYRFKGAVVPGVSTILTPCVDFGDAPIEKVRAAAVRGKHVHRACELFDLGTLDEDDLDPVLKPYLEGWKKFRREWPMEWTRMEEPQYSEKHGYAGTKDREGNYVGPERGSLKPGAFVKVDLKATYKLNDSVEIQLSGYDLMDERLADELWSVRVTKTGTYERHVHKPVHALFLSLLNVYRWRTSKGLVYPKW